MPTRILVAGASGALGRHVLSTLRARGYWVRAMTRREPAQSGLTEQADEVCRADAMKDDLGPAMEGIDWVLSSVGASVIPGLGRGWRRYGVVDVRANRRLIAAARDAGIQKMGYVSVYAAEKFPQIDYLRAHHTVAQELAQSGLQHTVIRPTGFYSVFAEFFRMGQKGKKVPMFGAGTCKTNPIDDRDLAKVCVDALEGDAPIIDCGGPDILTRREMIDLVFATLGKPPRIRKVSPGLVRFVSLCLRLVHPRMSHLLAFIATIMTHDLVAPAVGTTTLADYYSELAAGGGEQNRK